MDGFRNMAVSLRALQASGNGGAWVSVAGPMHDADAHRPSSRWSCCPAQPAPRPDSTRSAAGDGWSYAACITNEVPLRFVDSTWPDAASSPSMRHAFLTSKQQYTNRTHGPCPSVLALLDKLRVPFVALIGVVGRLVAEHEIQCHVKIFVVDRTIKVLGDCADREVHRSLMFRQKTLCRRPRVSRGRRRSYP